MNYRNMLLERGRIALEREAEQFNHLDEKNRSLRVAWLIRWHERRPHIDPWAAKPYARYFYDRELTNKRVLALCWLSATRTLQYCKGMSKVVNLWGRALNGRN